MNIRIETLERGVVALTFDRPGANIFDEAMLQELDERVAELEERSDLTGLILRSSHSSIFIAGADLHALSREGDAERLQEMAATGQRVFRRLAKLPITKVAAIHGACLGGGYECTLACDYRLGSTHKSTKIGLPETSLGIFPGWTGCTLLPRLIGVPKALDVILSGKRMDAAKAKRYGLVDAVVPQERLEEQAMEWCRNLAENVARVGLKIPG